MFLSIFVKGAGHVIRRSVFNLKTVTFVCASWIFINGSHLIATTHIGIEFVWFHMINARELGQDCSCLFLVCLFLMQLHVLVFARLPFVLVKLTFEIKFVFSFNDPVLGHVTPAVM